jgi:hypothetical protein
MGGQRVRSGRRTIGKGAIRMIVFVVYFLAPRSSFCYDGMIVETRGLWRSSTD